VVEISFDRVSSRRSRRTLRGRSVNQAVAMAEREELTSTMTAPAALSNNTRNVPATSAELDFSLVLARVIGSIENDPAQLRSAVYELARIKLEREAWRRDPPMTVSEIHGLMVALDAAVDRVESVSLRHDESRAVRSLDRMIESSTQRRAHHSNDVDPNSILVIDGAASTKSYGSRLPKPFAAWDARTPSRNSHRSRLFQLLSVCIVALFGLAAYLVLQRPFVLSGPPTAPPAESSSAASQTDTSVAPSATLGGQSPRLTLPKVYGVYAISGGQLVQLEPLAITVPDRRVFMSTPIKKASGTLLSDGRVTFIAFRRDISAIAPERVAVRVVAKIARAMTFSPGASVNTAQVDDEWTIRNASYELRVAPVSENPDMLMFQSEDPEFVFPSGRYALVLKSQAFDFTVAGPITEPTQCLERTEAANGTFYSECRKP
jgi:hypothetical protein